MRNLKWTLGLSGILIISFLSCTNAQNSKEDLKKVISKGAILVDVRTPQEFSEGSVKGATNIPLNTLENNLSKLNKDKDIVVFCRSGNRSSQAKTILEKNGYTKVYNGGSWQDVDKLTTK